MISELGKRETIAAAVGMVAKEVPKVELGVCMGPCSLTGKSLFITVNGSLETRAPKHTLEPSYIPFNWAAKAFVPVVNIPPTL